MAWCNHCKKWEPERDGACRLCRLCLAITRVAGDRSFSEEIYDRTSAQLAELLGNLTSEVLLVSADERRTSRPPPPADSREGGGRKSPLGERGTRAGASRHHSPRKGSHERDRSRRRRRDRRSSERKVKQERNPSPPRETRDRRRDRGEPETGSSVGKKEEDTNPKRARREASPAVEQGEKDTSVREEDPRASSASKAKSKPPAEWIPHLRPREGPSQPPPAKPRAEVVLKGASGTPVPEETESAPSASYLPTKGKGKGKTGGRGNKGWGKNKYSAPYSWSSSWDWNDNWSWGGSWDNTYQDPQKKKNKGKKRDAFIGQKIEERRAKAKSKSSAAATSPGRVEESESSSQEGNTVAPGGGELPPEGTIIAENTETPGGGDLPAVGAVSAEAAPEAAPLRRCEGQQRSSSQG